MLQGNRRDQGADSRKCDTPRTCRPKNDRCFPIGSESTWFKQVPLRKIMLNAAHFTSEPLQHFRDDNSCECEGLGLDDH